MPAGNTRPRQVLVYEKIKKPLTKLASRKHSSRMSVGAENSKPLAQHASRKHSSRTSVGACRKLKKYSQNMQAENTRPGRMLVYAEN
jgi:hypothetical protein